MNSGKVEMLDLFESTPLFRKLWPKLLKSYAVDAANAVTSDNEADADNVCSREDACQFLSEFLNAETQESTVEGGIALTKRSNERLVTYAADDEEAGMFGGMGGFGAPIHAAGYSR